MIRLEYSQELKIEEETAVTIGKFDGIHRGHELLSSMVRDHAVNGVKSLIVTFTISPRNVFSEEEQVKTLITSDERAYILEREGTDYLLELPLSEEVMHMSAEDFVKMLSERFHMKYLCVGSDFHFGYQGKGDASLLQELKKEYHFELDVVPKIKKDQRDISSTFIREEIRAGHIQCANELLGYPYFIWGEIVHGNHIGTGMGIPTINMIPPEDKLLPPNGVYITEVEIDHRKFHGITNVGKKPTIKSDDRINVETHILDFQGNLYEKIAKVSFLDFVREERKFESLEALTNQIRKDTQAAFAFFNQM